MRLCPADAADAAAASFIDLSPFVYRIGRRTEEKTVKLHLCLSPKLRDSAARLSRSRRKNDGRNALSCNKSERKSRYRSDYTAAHDHSLAAHSTGSGRGGTEERRGRAACRSGTRLVILEAHRRR